MTKLLSIIIPSYNMEAYLRKTLQSLFVSDPALFRTLDVIVVNDGSKDATSQIAHEFADQHPSVFRVIDKPNGHYGSCVNCALTEATGEFVKILDADDSYDTAELEKFLRELDRLRALTPSVDLVLSHVNYVDPNGQTIEKLEYPFGGRDDISLDELTALKSGRFIHGYTYRRSVFKNLNYHQSEGIAYTDTEWIFLPMTRVTRIAHCPLLVYCYLIGREDQSCNMAMMRRQLAHTRRTFDVQLDQYRRLNSAWSPAARRYAENHITNFAASLYVGYLMHGYWPYRKEIRALDKIRTTVLRELQSKFSGIYILTIGKILHIDYGKLAARHPTSRPVLAIALWFKQRLTR